MFKVSDPDLQLNTREYYSGGNLVNEEYAVT